MTTVVATTPATPEKGRKLLWVGVGVCLLGLLLVMAQFSLKILIVPWYSPALATLGAVLVLVYFVRSPGVGRGIALLLIAAFAGFQWYSVGWSLKLPAYTGPAQPGKQLPTFSATRADGETFTENSLHDGRRRVLVFFRGRW